VKKSEENIECVTFVEQLSFTDGWRDPMLGMPHNHSELHEIMSQEDTVLGH